MRLSAVLVVVAACGALAAQAPSSRREPSSREPSTSKESSSPKQLSSAKQPSSPKQAAPVPFTITDDDDRFLEDLSRRSFSFFWEQTDAATGIVRDRARTDGTPPPDARHADIGSIASTGFG